MGNLVVVRLNSAKFAIFWKKSKKEGSDTYKIREGLHRDCNSDNVIYLITSKKSKNSI